MSTQKFYSGVRRSELGVSGERSVVESKIERKCYIFGGVEHLKWECLREVKPRSVVDKPQVVENPTRVVKYYSCQGGKDHILKGYPVEPNIYCRLNSGESGLRQKGTMAGVLVSCIYLDTEYNQMLVRAAHSQG